MTGKASKELIGQLSDYLAERIGIYFPEGRWNDLERGVKYAAQDFGFPDVETCIRWLLLSPLTKKQIETLAARLTVGETYFFRDKKSFELLEGKVLPELIQKRREAGKYLRIWSAGCATGEEPYSVAMLLRRLIPDIKDWNITILATDINASFLHKAAESIYGEWSFRDVPSWLKDAFFRKAGKDRLELLPDVRKAVTFSYLNLSEDAYPSLTNNTNGMDVILCRNVLMYFTDKSQRKVVEKLYRCLVNGGWLMVSPAEISPLQSLPMTDAQLSAPAICKNKTARECTVGYNAAIYPVDQNTISEPPPSLTSHAGREEYTGERLTLGLDEWEGEVDAPQSIVYGPGDDADPYYAALKLYERGCYPEAEEKISALPAGENDSGRALALLSRINANQGRLTEAHDFCERAIAADKLNPAYQYLLASILLEMGREDESKTCLGRALYLDQDFALAHFALGNLSRRRGMKKESGRHFENALSILKKYRPDDILTESEGITAERMIEIINMAIAERA
jgi:chemotaxis protein methyltransferase CheR